MGKGEGKGWIIMVVMFVAMFAASSGSAWAVQEDNWADKTGDWLATAGKPRDEADRILVQRRADRAAKRLRESMRDSSKKAGKAMKKFGEDMDRMFDSR